MTLVLQGVALFLVIVGFSGSLVVNSVLFKPKNPVESSLISDPGNVDSGKATRPDPGSA